MLARRAFMASLVAAFVVLSVLADRGATQRMVTGTVGEFEAGDWMSVVNEKTDPMGFRIALHETTDYESPAAVRPGVRVTIWYRNVGERHLVADRVRVLAAAATH